MSHIFLSDLKIIDPNTWIGTTLIVLVTCMMTLTSSAYEPGVSELEPRIIALELEVSRMELDTNVTVAQILEMKDSIIDIQKRIFEAKEASINALRRQQSSRTDNRETLGFIAFGMLLVAVLSFGFVYLFGKRLKMQEGAGVLQVLANDLQASLSPEEQNSRKNKRVHFLVWLSVIIMFMSMVMYLFRVL